MTWISIAAIVVGIVILLTGYDNGQFFWFGIVALVAGVGTLIWHMKDGPPIDSGWDDGAVV